MTDEVEKTKGELTKTKEHFLKEKTRLEKVNQVIITTAANI